MLKRRDILKLTLGSAAGTLAPVLIGGARADDKAAQDTAARDTATPDKPAAPAAPASAPEPSVAGPGILLAPPVDFAASTVTDLARTLSKQPFKPVSNELPSALRSLSPGQYYGIRLKPEARIWGDDNLGFVIEPQHRGFQYLNPIQINLVTGGKAYRLVYDVKLFDFGKLKPPTDIGDIGFSGFNVLTRRDKGDTVEVASFWGANFFRALADGQVPGLLARALALKIGDAKGEEVPIFRSIWIEKPGPVAQTLVVHALIDSESVSGAFRFTIHPGGIAIIDTECTLFPRAYIENYGLAAMSATHLLGFMDHKKFDDYRPNVSEVCGIQMLTGREEWVWRPVTNRESLQISTFLDSKPRGFGCMIRNRDFEDYDDEENHWERRPSLWIEPIGEWGEGGVQLIEIPSQSDANDNILCFWRPNTPLKIGSEVFLAYRQFWCWDPPQAPPLARATRSRAGSSGKRQRFFVEFTGDILADESRTKGFSTTLTAGRGAITMTRVFWATDRKSCRILFELDPNGEDSVELRLLLKANDQPLSETWLYRWTPT